METDDEPYEAAEYLLAFIDSREGVEYAEVGAVSRQTTAVSIGHGDAGPPEKTDDTGVWCRAYVDGAAEYGYLTDEYGHLSSLNQDAIEMVGKRVVRTARELSQAGFRTEPPSPGPETHTHEQQDPSDEGNEKTPAEFEPERIIRTIHDGWGFSDIRPARVDIEQKVSAITSARETAFTDIEPDEIHLKYDDEQVDKTVMTSTGSLVATSLDRGSLNVSLRSIDGREVRHHVGSTTGTELLDRLETELETVADRFQRVTGSSMKTLDPDESRTTVALHPDAATDLFHHLSHYFEIDATFLGISPIEQGDRIAPPLLTMKDVPQPGSFGARAYDAEATPVHPVTLLDRGRVNERLYDVPSAYEAGEIAKGHVIPSKGFGNAPRIHCRHLDIPAGASSLDALLADADLLIRSFGKGYFTNERARAERSMDVPPSSRYVNRTESLPSVLYSKKANDRLSDERVDISDQGITLQISEAFRIEDDQRTSVLENGQMEFSLEDLATVSCLTTERETRSGVCEKHRSSLPYAVTAPGILFETTVSPSDIVSRY